MDKQQLIERISSTALLRGDFTLRSGRKSSYYLDKYLFETQPDILAALGELFAQHADDSVDRFAGAELGGIPLVAAAAMAANLPMVLIRNQKKDYGTEKRLEGVLNAGDQVMIVEDIATSGGQILEAAAVICEAGATVNKIVAVIDRQEGAREKITSAGYVFESLFTKTDLGIGN